MTFLRSFVIFVVAVLLISVAAGWWYFYGPNMVSAAKLVPSNTLVFAVIPNATSIGTGYETSELKKLVDSPNAQPALDHLTELVGPKNVELLKAFLPNLSGQSFVALTHFDSSKPQETGFVAGMKPKPGLDTFDNFIKQVNATYPDLLRETKTGQGKLLDVDYQWIQGNNQPGRICVAHYHGWIVTAWGEASLQDWIERVQGKSATPSLADNANYQKSIDRVGKGSQTIIYFDYQGLMKPLIQQLGQTSPDHGEYLTKQIANIGGMALSSSFEHGNIVDRISVLEPRAAMEASGQSVAPCAFETLKFTGPNTLAYTGANVNWQGAWKNFQAQEGMNPGIKYVLDGIKGWAQSENIDVEKNLINALGSEFSVQLEWSQDDLYPDLGIFVKVDHPDDFKPVTAAILDTARKQFSTVAVINEMNSNGHNYATLKMVRPMPFGPTITEDGPYFGLFLNQTHAVRSFARDENAGLLHNDDFKRQLGDNRSGATQIVFLDTPHLLDHGYRTVLPYLSMGAMFNPQLAALLKDRQLPPDLTWLAPMGTWSAWAKIDDDGMTGTSVSGIGNQGVLLAGGVVGAAAALQMSGLLPQHHYTVATPGAPTAPAIAAPAPAAAPATPSNVTPATPVTPADSTH